MRASGWAELRNSHPGVILIRVRSVDDNHIATTGLDATQRVESNDAQFSEPSRGAFELPRQMELHFRLLVSALVGAVVGGVCGFVGFLVSDGGSLGDLAAFVFWGTVSGIFAGPAVVGVWSMALGKAKRDTHQLPTRPISLEKFKLATGNEPNGGIERRGDTRLGS